MNPTGTKELPSQTSTEQASLGSFDSYADAQRVIDFLADHHFEVGTTQIIGTDLRMVEQITGRLTWTRVVISGVASGAWFGVFVGLLINILGTATFLRAILFGVTWGILFGGAFAAVGYAMTAGRRDFTSLRVTVPSHFEILVASAHQARAQTVLVGMPR